MRRRDFAKLAALGLACPAVPIPARAQSEKAETWSSVSPHELLAFGSTIIPTASVELFDAMGL
jgi:hypothetical protein